MDAMRPRIGITCGYRPQEPINGHPTALLAVDARFCDVVFDGGGEPLLIPPAAREADLLPILSTLSGLILTGGPDIPPERYGAKPHPETKLLHPRRVAVDFAAAKFADDRELAVLAICCGIQEWNVHRGGTLHQHLPDLQCSPQIKHRDGTSFSHHPVRVDEKSLLYSIVKTASLPVNSSHHQGLDRLGGDLRATAWAADGLIEAVEDPRRPFCLGIQWHPEDMPGDPVQEKIFQAMVAAAGRIRPGGTASRPS